MDYMFKDVYNLKSVEIISNKNLEILSMISSFENCENLEKVKNKGFNTNNIKSMKKLFYNSKINEFDLDLDELNITTNNVEDMPYMFARIKSEKLNLVNLNTENVITMKEMFSSCSSLINLNITNFNTK